MLMRRKALLNQSFIFSISANIALGKNACQSSDYNGNTRAEKAVDGLKSDLSYSSGECAIADIEQKTVMWRVDLGVISSIQNITIYYRTENLFWSKIISSLYQRYILKYKNVNTNVQIIFRYYFYMRVKLY